MRQCSNESAARGKRKRQNKRPSPKHGNMQIPSIRIISKGEPYFINRAIGFTNRQPINEEHENTETNEINMEILQANDGNNELTRHEESWMVATSSKKREVTPLTSGRNTRKKTMAAVYQAE